MRQKSIGEVLRATRESRGWSLADAQRMTTIQSKYLQALEYNDFEFIPDSAYTRSFLQTYAEVLELDAAVLLDAYDRNSLVMYYEPGDEEGPERRRSYKVKKKKASYLPLIYLLLASTFILLFVTYIVYTRVQNQARTADTDASYSVVSQSTTTVESTTEETEQESVESTTSSSSSETQEVQLTTSGSGNALSVTVTGATEPVEVSLSVSNVTSWISLTDTNIASGFTLSPDTPTISATLPEGTTTATLVLGVVRGVEITIAGKPLDTSALTTQSATVYLTIEQ